MFNPVIMSSIRCIQSSIQYIRSGIPFIQSWHSRWYLS